MPPLNRSNTAACTLVGGIARARQAQTLGSTAHGHEEPEEAHAAEVARQERSRAETVLERSDGVRVA